MSYAAPVLREHHWLLRKFARLPHWVIALMLFLPVMASEFFGIAGRFAKFNGWPDSWILSIAYGVALFVPGALRRLKGLHVLFMLAAAAVWILIDQQISRWFEFPYPFSFLVWTLLPTTLVGLIEWILVRPRQVIALPWMLIFFGTAGALSALVIEPFQNLDVNVAIPQINGPALDVSLFHLIQWPLLSCLTWMAIPLAQRLARSKRRAIHLKAAAVVVIANISFLLFYQHLMYRLAIQSLVSGRPFDAYRAETILRARNRPADYDELWDSLEQVDWSRPYVTGARVSPGEIIDILAVRDPQRAASLVSEILRMKPNRDLADDAANLLVKTRHYETFPLLLRLGLLRDSHCWYPLYGIKLPQAALAMIFQNSLEVRPFISTGDIELGPGVRGMLTPFLGHDAGPNTKDWLALYDAVSKQLPTPVSAEIKADCERVAAIMVLYYRSEHSLNESRARLFARRMNDAGLGNLLPQLSAGNQAVTTPRVDQIYTQVFLDMQVPAPDWTVPSTDALELEVKRYIERVNAIIVKFDQPTTAPVGARSGEASGGR